MAHLKNKHKQGSSVQCTYSLGLSLKQRYIQVMSDIPHNRPARLSLIFSNIGNWEIPVKLSWTHQRLGLAAVCM